MREPLPQPDTAQAPAWATRLHALAEAGAAWRAPLDWHLVSVLAQRAQTESGALQARLIERLHQHLEALHAQLQAPSHAALAAPATDSPLAALLHAMGARPVAAASTTHAPTATHTPTHPHTRTPTAPDRPAHTAPAPVTPTAPPELRSVGRMRKTLARLKVGQQVRQALAQPPEHAGPINSQMLVLRSLALMQDIAPEYLHRFMSHVDALMTLEDAQRLPVAATPSARSPAKATHPARKKPGKR